MRKTIISAAIATLALFSSGAMAQTGDVVGGAHVSILPAPSCLFDTFPTPYSKPFWGVQHMISWESGPTPYSPDPFVGTPFAGRAYVVLTGAHHEGNGLKYVFSTPQMYAQAGWGTPNIGNWFEFFAADGTSIVKVTGRGITNKYYSGSIPTAVNVLITMPKNKPFYSMAVWSRGGPQSNFELYNFAFDNHNHCPVEPQQ